MNTAVRTIVEWRRFVRGWLYRLLPGVWFKRLGKGARLKGRQIVYRPLMNITVGDDALLGERIYWQVARNAKVRIGDRFSINSGSFIVISAGLQIGHNVAIGELVSIRDSEHRFDPEHGVRDQGFKESPIIIEDNCWIGRGVYLGPGSHIRKGSIVAANSVVQGEYPAASLIAGAPATVKRSLTSKK